MKQAHLMDMLKKASKCVHTSTTVVISWLLVSYSINFCNYKDSRKHRRGPWWPSTSRSRRHSNGTLLWLALRTKCRSSNKPLPART